ncbi:hypothetical protein SIO70_09090 [Chitinophaga sancti]|uniref:hypothetical protein n=1 Tax=Chitinophaga sancti TaxID=1004 RepID=UPI002A74A298|nr:hypothetical protein [Chitinophaga sancti]WPQ65006.1 hypothetical protein SIO70_09090 [Chitinophaga sancti]
MKNYITFLLTCTYSIVCGQTPINRQALVERHNVTLHQADTLAALTLGNGNFAFTVDVTGLQTFPEAYSKGIPLGTQSGWGWHSFPNSEGYKIDDAYQPYHLHGRDITYTVQKKNTPAVDYFRQNVHRLQLGNIGFQILKRNGQPATLDDIQQVDQVLDLWNGEVRSAFTVEGVPVKVRTVVHPQKDLLSIKIISPLVKQGRLKIRIRLPYPTGEFADAGTDYQHPDRHQSSVIKPGLIIHELDSTHYYLNYSPINTSSPHLHEYLLTPDEEITVEFSPREAQDLPSFAQTEKDSRQYWQAFWKRGGAVDFNGSTDPRAFELERRVVLSQYLMAVQCAGYMPPQETGLTYNSWYGKPHLEMYWWHAVHFALWGRADLMEKSLQWYATVADKARAIAQRQGYKGIRWQKMTDPEGNESPSSVGAFLIWQQPHFIYMAELLYRQHPEVLTKYQSLVAATADFMASYAWYDSATHHYILGKGLIPAQERFKPEDTYNPTYELAYWRWGLQTAQRWRERAGLPRNPEWDQVLNGLSPLPQQEGLYLAAESAPDSYTRPAYMTDHPAVLGTLGMLPTSAALDTAVMHHTLDKIWTSWDWKDTWGWDFPLTCMTAVRLGQPERAIDALFMNIKTNTWLPNGHNYQDDRLRLYLPGNGGLLTAVALMCAGFDGCTIKELGIPKNGKWKIKWEGLQPMP